MNTVPEEPSTTIALFRSSLDGRHIPLALSAKTFEKIKFLYLIKQQS